MMIEIRKTEKNKKGKSYWSYRLTDEGKTIFDNSVVSVKILSEKSAKWIVNIISDLHRLNIQIPRKPVQLWSGNLDDDCSLTLGNCYAHAEHLNGPYGKGGVWFCMVGTEDITYFHTADHDIQPRSGKAARWLSELIILAIQNNIIKPE